MRSPGAGVDRLHALDAVRAYALLLGVVLHAAAAFLEGFPIPLWQDEPATPPTVLYYVIHMFRMSAFFLIAGFFARMLVERRGTAAFVKDRAKRVALPLVVFLPVFMLTAGLALVAGALPHGTTYLTSLLAQPAADQPPPPGGVNLAHLWFLYYLLIFYALALAARALVHASGLHGSVAGMGDRVVAFLMRGVWGPLLIALPIALYCWRMDDWIEWLGLPAPFMIVPQMHAIVGYGVPFALGWLLHRQVPALLDLRRRWWLYLALALALTVVCLSIVGTTPRWEGSTLAGPERIVYALAYTTGLWCWVFAFVGAAVRYLSGASPATRYLSDASYWIYLMHMTTLMFFITLLRPFEWHWSVKLAIAVGGSMPILLVSYHYLVRFTWVGVMLNGRRHPRPGVVSPPDAVPAPG